MLDNVINVILLEEHIMLITLKIRLRIEFAIELKLFLAYIPETIIDCRILFKGSLFIIKINMTRFFVPK